MATTTAPPPPTMAAIHTVAAATTTTTTTTTKKRQRAAAIAALVQRFEAARAAQHSAQLAADADALIAEGTVRDLIALFNGMARSVPDYPRAAYSRSKRAPRAVAASTAGIAPLAPVSIANNDVLPATPSRSTLDELVSVMGLSDDDSAAALEWLATNDDAELADLARECCCVDTDDEDGDELTDDTNQLDDTDDDDSEEQDEQSEPIETAEDVESNQEADDELSTCDDTASIYSLSSSCMSDCSFEDDASDASLYYERAFRVHCQAPPAAAAAAQEPPQQQEQQQEKEEEEAPQPAAAAVVVEPVTVALAEPTPSSVETPAVETAPIETAPIETPPALLLLAASPVKELPTRIPISVGSSLRTPPSSPTKPASAPRTMSPKAPIAVLGMAPTPVLTAPPAPVKPKRVPSPIKTAPVRSLYKTTPAPPASVITPRGAALSTRVAGNAASPARRRKRWEPTTPRKPVERPICPRHAAAAHASSPCKHSTDMKRPLRRNSISDTKSRAPTSSLAALRTTAPGASGRSSGSAPAASARIANAKVPPPSPSSLGRSMTRTAASVVPPAPKSAPSSIASHTRTEATRLRTRSHDIGARLSSSSVAPVPTPEIRPNRIRSRLFDYEHDPKRLELIAANRARRRSVDFLTMQAV